MAESTARRRGWLQGCVTFTNMIRPRKVASGIAAEVSSSTIKQSSAPGWLARILLPDEAEMSAKLTKLLRDEAAAQITLPTGLAFTASADAWATTSNWVGTSFSVTPAPPNP